MCYACRRAGKIHVNSRPVAREYVKTNIVVSVARKAMFAGRGWRNVRLENQANEQGRSFLCRQLRN